MIKKSGVRKVGGRRIGAVRRRRGGLRRRLPLYKNANRIGGPNTCRVSETLPLQNMLPNTPYIISVGGITGTRAQSIAPNFGLYRIARVVFKFKPWFDTFISTNYGAGGAGAVSVPNLYWKMNRFADQPAAFTADDLKTMGAKPLRLDDKTLTVSYKPSILVDQASGGSHSGSVKISPWLNTDDAPDTPNFALSTTEHYGHFFIVECAVNGNGSTPVGTWEATIYYEFKNPRTMFHSSSVQAIKTDLTTLVTQ